MPKSRSCLLALSILLLCVPLAAACQKAPPPIGEKLPTFGIYLLDNDEQVLSGDDISSFDPETGYFELTSSGVDKWQSRFAKTEPKLKESLFGRPFIIKIGNEGICSGTIWSMLSSASRQDIVLLDALGVLNGKLKLQLGYGGFEANIDPAISSAIADYFNSR